MKSIFSNTKDAFSLKTDFELLRAKFLFNIIQNKFLVKLGTSLTNFSLKFNLPVTFLIKATVFDHFCGGVSEEDCNPVINKLFKNNVHSVLDFSTEGFNSEASTALAYNTSLPLTKRNENNIYSLFKKTNL